MTSQTGSSGISSGIQSKVGRKAAGIFAKGVAFLGLGTVTNGRQDRQCLFCKHKFGGLRSEVACMHILTQCQGDPPPSQEARDAAGDTTAAKDEKDERAALPPVPQGGRKRSRTLEGWVDTAAVTTDMKKKFDTALFLWVVMAGLSFAAVDSPYFLQFIALIRPNYNPAGVTLIPKAAKLDPLNSAPTTTLADLLRCPNSQHAAAAGRNSAPCSQVG